MDKVNVNNVEQLIKQQIGYGMWKKCNSSLAYLRCTKEENFNKIVPNDVMYDFVTMDPPIFACKFAAKKGQEHILALANEDGTIAIHNTMKKEARYGVEAHHNAIFDLAWMFGQMKLVSVSGDHSARLFDVGSSDIVEQQVFTGHTRSVKTVAFKPSDSSGFATGGRDGSILIWDARLIHTASTIVNPDDRLLNSHKFSKTPVSRKKRLAENGTVSGANSVTGLVFQDDFNLISCGAGDGIIKIWDMRKTYSIHKREAIPKCTLPYTGPTSRNGFSNLTIDSSGMKLYANCLDNTIYCYNISTYLAEPVMKYSGFQNSTFYVKSCLSFNGHYLLSGSSDHNAYIWDINQEEPIISLTGHNAEVTCVAWCNRSEPVLVTCSDDLKHKIWRIGTECLPENWDVEGRGDAQTINRNTSKLFAKRLRLLSEDDHESTMVKRWKGTPNKRKNEEAHSSVKRQKFERGPKRLFTNIDLNAPSTSGHLNHLPIIFENVENKEPKNLNDLEKQHYLENLPNFAIDGVAPHINTSPLKQKDKDWLTKLRLEKNMTKMNDPSPSKMAKFEPKSPQMKSQTKSSALQSPLLKFFRITNNSVGNNSQQCSKSSSIPAVQNTKFS